MPSFGKTSTKRLQECHPDLILLFNIVIMITDCTIICGHRTEEEQQKAFDNGNSTVQFPNSRHNSEPAMAIDVAPWPLDWNDIEGFKELSKTVKDCAELLNIDIQCGGDWINFKDYPHYQLKK